MRNLVGMSPRPGVIWGVVVGLAAVFSQPASSMAQLSLEVFGDSDVLLGQDRTLAVREANGSAPGMTQSIKWYFKAKGSSTWIDMNLDNFTEISFRCGRIGEVDLKCSVEFAAPPMGMPARPAEHPTMQIDVLKPNNTEIISGLNTPILFGNTGQLVFKLKRDDDSIGGHFSGWAQESIGLFNIDTFEWDFDLPTPPSEMNVTEDYYLSANLIIDTPKYVNSLANWNAKPVPSVLFNYKLIPILNVKDWGDNWHFIELPAHTLKWEKTSTTEWTIFE